MNVEPKEPPFLVRRGAWLRCVAATIAIMGLSGITAALFVGTPRHAALSACTIAAFALSAGLSAFALNIQPQTDGNTRRLRHIPGAVWLFCTAEGVFPNDHHHYTYGTAPEDYIRWRDMRQSLLLFAFACLAMGLLLLAILTDMP